MSSLTSNLAPLLSPLERQHYQRLKVNRIAFIQELKVDHILQTLLDNSVLSTTDVKFILSVDSFHDRTKRLLDILPTKGRNTHWYDNFRMALLNPSVDDSRIKQKYQILVEFLDNTIVEQMRHPVSRPFKNDIQIISNDSIYGIFSKYNPLPGIGDNASRPPTIAHQFRMKAGDSTEEIRGSPAGEDRPPCQPNQASPPAQQPPSKALTSKLNISSSYIEGLLKSSHAADVALGKLEASVALKALRIEEIYNKWLQGSLLDVEFLCQEESMLELILKTDKHHLYFKYFDRLITQLNADIVKDLVESFCQFCTSSDLSDPDDGSTRERVINTGLCLSELSVEFRATDLAESALTSMITCLETNTGPECYVAVFNSLVKLISLYIHRKDFQLVEDVKLKADQYKEQIALLSLFGNGILNLSEFHLQMSLMAREQGRFGMAYTLAQRAVQELERTNPQLTVKVLCNASAAYGNQWNIPRADDLAVEAIKQAKNAFGVYHPTYLEALINYANFSNEYRQDSFSVEAASAAVQISQKIYGYSHIQVAKSLEVMAVALLVTGKNASQCVSVAEQAYKLAVVLLPVRHALLCSYRHTLGLCLIARANASDDPDVQRQSLLWAQGEAKTMLTDAEKYYGEYSGTAAEALDLLGYINVNMNRLDEAADNFTDALQRLSHCISPKHGSIFMVRAALSRIAKLQGDDAKHITILTDIVDNFDTNMYYISWFSNACEKLASSLDEAGETEKSNEYRSKHLAWKWMSEDNRREVSWRDLHAPPESIDRFVSEFDIWARPINLVREELEKLKSN